jgi:nucleoside-diphosphate-sugar epimerase
VRIFVTGDRGYIGAMLVPLLEERGMEVVGWDADFYRDCEFGDGPQRISGVRRDIRDVAVEDLVGFDVVVHLAALSNDPLSDLDPALTDDINFRASVRLAHLARAAGVGRFIFSSSCSNYGSSGRELIDENASFNPVSQYGISKVKAEGGIVELATGDFCPVLLRSATAYGVSPRLRCDVVLNNLVAWALTTGKVRIKSDGLAWRPLVHVEDICRAFLSVLEAPRESVQAQAFNVVPEGENYRIREVAAIVGEVSGCDIEFADEASPDARNYRVDGSKIAAVLPSFRPCWSVRSGAEQLFEAFSENPITLDDCEGWRYRRVGQLSRLMDMGEITPDLRWKRQR